MRNLLRHVVVLASLVVCLAARPDTAVAGGDESLAVFLTLPMTNGFSDATHALVETKELVRAALSADSSLRLVDRAEDADVVLTMIGRGRGHAELTEALKNISRNVVAPSVPIGGAERYIEILLTTGSCRTTAIAVEKDAADSCYRRIFVGVAYGDLDRRRPAKTSRPSSWEACADDLVRDVRAWLTTNATRLRALRAVASLRFPVEDDGQQG